MAVSLLRESALTPNRGRNRKMDDNWSGFPDGMSSFENILRNARPRLQFQFMFHDGRVVRSTVCHNDDPESLVFIPRFDRNHADLNVIPEDACAIIVFGYQGCFLSNEDRTTKLAHRRVVFNKREPQTHGIRAHTISFTSSYQSIKKRFVLGVFDISTGERLPDMLYYNDIIDKIEISNGRISKIRTIEPIAKACETDMERYEMGFF
tara:strand:+ start:254 stop:874 length:621 start_codon:yes stop_codon:yes gene_type:complete